MILITHWDLDGAVSEIVLSRFIHFDKKKASGYTKFAKYISELKQGEEVIFSDVSLSFENMDALIEKTHNFIIIDHHPDTAKLIKRFPEFKRKIFFDVNVCGAMLCKRYVQEHFPDVFNDKWNTYLDDLVDITDVYDIWRTDNKLWAKAYSLDILYWHHSHWDFVKIFRNGYAISPDDKSFIKTELLKKSKLFKEAEKIEVGNNILFVICSREITNDFTLFYGTKYDMFFLVSFDERNGIVLSVRTALPLGDFSFCYSHIEKMFPDLIISAGGHPKAGGITVHKGVGLDDVTKICEEFSLTFLDNLVPF